MPPPPEVLPLDVPLLLVPLDVPLLVPLDVPLLLVPLDVPLLLVPPLVPLDVPLLVPLDVPLLLSDPLLLVPEDDSLPEELVPLEAPLLPEVEPLLVPCCCPVPSPVPPPLAAAQAEPRIAIPRAKRQTGDVRKSWRTRTSSGLEERQAPGTLSRRFCADGTVFLQNGSIIQVACKTTPRWESEIRVHAASMALRRGHRGLSDLRNGILHCHRHSQPGGRPFQWVRRCPQPPDGSDFMHPWPRSAAASTAFASPMSCTSSRWSSDGT